MGGAERSGAASIAPGPAPLPVQLRFKTTHTSEQYVSQQAWLQASLMRCPLHPDGGCGFKRHGTYERRQPPGAHVARWYCPPGRMTFSLLPDCLAARLPGSLAELEQVVRTVEQSPSMEAAADRLRPDIDLPGRLRWARRRQQRVRASLVALIRLQPEVLGGCEPTLSALARRLTKTPVMPALRSLGEPCLQTLPPPLGFAPPTVPQKRTRRQQHRSGPRAPPSGW